MAAKSYIVLDLTSNQTLAEREADTPADPASLTKLMTAYVVFNALHDKKLALDQKLPVSKRAWAERKGGGSLMFIDTTMTPTVDELLRGMIVQSGNDASVVLAEAVGGTSMNSSAMMNRQAQAWGLKNTAFKNVTGLTETGHQSTARDLAMIATHIIRDFPEFFPYYSIKEYKYNNITQPNRNLLLRRDPTVDGMKTGYTEAAGYCLMATAQREFPNLGANGAARQAPADDGGAEHHLDGSAREREPEAAELGLPGLRHDAPVRRRQADRHAAGLEGQGQRGQARRRRRRCSSGCPRARAASCRPRSSAPTRWWRRSPRASASARSRSSTRGGRAVVDVPLVVLEPVEQAGIFGRAWDAIRLWIK